MQLEKVNCNLCQVDDAQLLFTGNDLVMAKEGIFNVVRCRRCSLIYINPRPKAGDLEYFYTDKYYSYQKPNEKKRSNIEQKILNINLFFKKRLLEAYFSYPSKIKRFIFIYKVFLFPIYLKLILTGKDVKYIPYKGDGRLLDIGCGVGNAMRFWKALGWKVWGVEVNRQAVAVALEDGLDVRLGNIEEIDFEDNFFDVITMMHTLEHTTNPLSTLIKVRTLLKKGGVLIVVVPNANGLDARFFKQYWFGWDIPRHLYNFSSHTIEKILKNAGFVIKKIKYDLGDGIIKDSLRLVYRYRHNKEFKEKFFSNSVLKIMGRLLGYLRLSGNIIIYATKVL